MAARALTKSFAASVAIQGLNIVTGVLLARSLAPAGRGELAAVLLWPMLVASLGSLGVPEALTYYRARRGLAPRSVARSAALLWVGQSAVLAAVGAGVAHIALAGHDADTRAAGYLMALAIPLYLATAYGSSLVQGALEFGEFNALRVLVPLSTALGLISLAVAGDLTVRAAAWVYVATYAVTGIAAGVLALRSSSAQSGAAGASGDILRFGLRSHASFVATTLNERLDQLLISLFLAPASLGLYVVAVTLTSLTSLVGSTVSLIALPQLASLEPGRERAAHARRLARLTLVTSAAIAVPVVVAAPALLGLFFGEAFVEVADVARILLIAAVVLSTGRLLAAILKGLGTPLAAGVGELTALAINVPALALLLPAFGLTGAAVASLVAYAVSAVWLSRRVAAAVGESSLTFWLGGVPRSVDVATSTGDGR